MLAVGMSFLPVFAQAQNGVGEARDEAVSYHDECRRHGIDCALQYGDKKQEVKPKSSLNLSLPNTSNSNLIVIVSLSLGFLLILGLWLYFGRGGVLLSAESKAKEQQTLPEGWHEGEAGAHSSSADFFQQIAMMANRQEALIKLLRHWLRMKISSKFYQRRA